MIGSFALNLVRPYRALSCYVFPGITFCVSKQLSRFTQVLDNEPDLSGRKNTLARRIAALEQFLMQLLTTDDPTAQAVTSLVRGQLRKVEAGEG